MLRSLPPGSHWGANDLEIDTNVFIIVNNYFSDYLTTWLPPNMQEQSQKLKLSPKPYFFCLPGSAGLPPSSPLNLCLRICLPSFRRRRVSHEEVIYYIHGSWWERQQISLIYCLTSLKMCTSRLSVVEEEGRRNNWWNSLTCILLDSSGLVLASF